MMVMVMVVVGGDDGWWFRWLLVVGERAEFSLADIGFPSIERYVMNGLSSH